MQSLRRRGRVWLSPAQHLVSRSVSGTTKARSSPVDVAASVYMHDLHRAGIFKDSVDHAVITSASSVQTAELAAEGLAYPLWIVAERPEDELDAGRGDLLWQSL
jgi:hypothetical protein